MRGERWPRREVRPRGVAVGVDSEVRAAGGTDPDGAVASEGY